jgi:hypothetical protein
MFPAKAQRDKENSLDLIFARCAFAEMFACGCSGLRLSGFPSRFKITNKRTQRTSR